MSLRSGGEDCKKTLVSAEKTVLDVTGMFCFIETAKYDCIGSVCEHIQSKPFLVFVVSDWRG